MNKALLLGAFGMLVLFVMPSSVRAVSGTCSYHGGVNCSVGPDWDGSAICNDGWTDSDEFYWSTKKCTEGRHYCSQTDAENLNSKFGLPGKEAILNSLNVQLEPYVQQAISEDFNSQSIYSDTAEVLRLTGLIKNAQRDITIALSNKYSECYALGDVAYAKQIAETYTRYNSQNTQTKTCATGYVLENNLCYTTSEFCSLKLGSGGYAYDDTHCACKVGFVYDSAKKSCIFNVTTSPVNNVSSVSDSIETCLQELGSQGIVVGQNKCGCTEGYILNSQQNKCISKPVVSIPKIQPIQIDIASSVSATITVNQKIDSSVSTTTIPIQTPKKSIWNKVMSWFKWW